MKVNEILRKVCRRTMVVPVILRDINDINSEREAWGLDFNNGYYKEKNRTVYCLEPKEDKFVIYYK